ncbi:type I secretion system permease/ATPase [Ruegeria sp.]|uniref:type I secretion system permease/ATPase n=1 Tax=Ruegeria sp. TaxID=1879320 RepID=UPI0023164CE3|nr:type I secretion system permease/ATPase [Ruegeria sp.]MDA7965353.1 type I secretion system permease/ATPase [Ruegeria sp.]
MSHSSLKRTELEQAFRAARPGLFATGSVSMVINLTMLTGPLFMILVYDRALPSQSYQTLFGLSVLMLGLYLVFGLLSLVRSRILVRIGNRLGNRLEKRVFEAQIERSVKEGGAKGRDAIGDLNTLREFMGGPTPAVIFDAPWTPIYLGFAYLLHPWLGYAGLAGVAFLMIVAMLNNVLTHRGVARATQFQTRSSRVLNDVSRNHEVAHAMRMREDLYQHWHGLNGQAQVKQSKISDMAATLSSISRTVRLMLQSAVLGLGAYLAISGDLSAGSIIAASVLVGRALAPAEQAIGSWRQYVLASAARKRLNILLDEYPPAQASVQLPQPRGDLDLKNVFAATPDGMKTVLRNVSLSLSAGEVLAVIGPSGSGKSTLARVIVGTLAPTRGSVRLDQADMSYWNAVQLRDSVGYMPQTVELFDGTVRENIARFQSDASDADVVAAAQAANAHDLILKLPNAYDTPLGESGSALSGGERQRIGLARVLYKNPSLIVLDEPNSNLDAAGAAALSMTIDRLKSEGRTVVIIAHRLGALNQADKVLVMDNGMVSAFGPKDEILRTYSENRKKKADESAKTTAHKQKDVSDA